MNQIDTDRIPTTAAIVIDRKGHVVGWNEGAEDVLGFAAEEVIGRASHDVLCGLDPEGRPACHPWCALSPGDDREDPDDDVVLYPRSAANNVICVTLSVLRVGGSDATVGWVVHLITSAKPVSVPPRMPWRTDPGQVPARRASIKSISTPRDPKNRKFPDPREN